jgi:hypothetical protein
VWMSVMATVMKYRGSSVVRCAFQKIILF